MKAFVWAGSLLALASVEAQVGTPESVHEPGTRVELSAVAKDGFHFIRWSGDVEGTENPIRVTMDADRTVTPVFRRAGADSAEGYRLSMTPSEGGTVAIRVVAAEEEPTTPPARGNVDLLEGISVIERPDPSDPKESRPASPLAMPEAGECVRDPDFGTRICRVSDAQALGFQGAGIVPMYSGTPAWNSDESLLLLYAPNGGGHHLFSGQPPYRYLRALPIAVGEPEAVYWDVEDPHRIRWVDKVNKRLLTMRVDPASDPEVVHDFQDICGPAANKLPFLVETHHWQSFDGRYWGFKCDPGDGNKKLIAYDLAADRILWIVPYTGSNEQGIWGAPMPSPSGRFFVTRQDVLEVRDRDTGRVLRSITPWSLAFNHMTMGIAEGDGREWDVYVTLYNEGARGENSGLVAILLETGRVDGAYMAEAMGYPYPLSGIHHSAISYEQPNFVWTSIIGSQSTVDPSQTDGQSVFGSEILVTDLRDGRVGRVAHHRSRRGLNPVYNAKYSDYWQEPHIAASPTGCRAVFGSDWSAGPQRQTPPQPKVDTFVVELPCFERARSGR